MKAFTQLIENKVMLSKLPKPDEGDYIIWDDSLLTRIQLGIAQIDGFDNEGYEKALKEFNDSIIGEAENTDWVKYDDSSNEMPIVILHPHGRVDSHVNEILYKPNQPCEVEKSGKLFRIKKI